MLAHERQGSRTNFFLSLCLLPLLAASARAQVTAPERKLTVGDEYAQPSGTVACERTIKARVVAIDQVLTYNRLGAFLPSGMMFALERDVVRRDPALPLGPGNAMLRPDKRPRPLVLRLNEGDCLEVTFTNWLAPGRTDQEQPMTRATRPTTRIRRGAASSCCACWTIRSSSITRTSTRSSAASRAAAIRR